MVHILTIIKKIKQRKVQPNLLREELIRATAYKYFEERNYEHGYAESDWLAAERYIDQSSDTRLKSAECT